MKKILTLLLTAALVLSLAAGFSLSSSAAVEYVEKEYHYEDMMEEYGNEETKTNPVFCGGLWMYEWYHCEEEKFGIMETWQDKTPDVSSSTMTNVYTALANSHEEYGMGAGTLDDYFYCAFRYNGKGIHPGSNVAAVITFVCPADGKVQFTASGMPNGANNVEEKNSTGNHLYVFLDEELVEEVETCYYNADKTPYETNVVLDVKAGQKIRYAVGGNGKRSSKGWTIMDMPVVAYLEASVPIGNPKGVPPTTVTTSDRTADGCTVSWDAVEGATGYNVYLGETKLTASPVTELSFKITGLEPETVYENLYVTSISAAGLESDPSGAKSFRTKQAEAASDTSTDASTGDSATMPEDDGSSNNTNANTNAPADTNSNAGKPAEKGNGALIGIIIAVAVVLVAAIVVVVILVLKKKKAAPAAE